MSKTSRDQKLLQLLTDLQTWGTKERLRLTREIALLEGVRAMTGLGAVASGNAEAAKMVVVDEINDFLKEL